jgi:hypothetical protein
MTKEAHYRRVMSAPGPSRHFAATQHFGRFGSEADIEPDLCVPA